MRKKRKKESIKGRKERKKDRFPEICYSVTL